MSAPIRRSASSRPVRRGLRPTAFKVTSDPGMMLAATMKNAAEEKSAGTAISVARRRWPPRKLANPGEKAISTPKAASMRSV